MRKNQRDTSLGEGVYFAADAYVGFIRRILILIIDSAVLVVVCALTITVSLAVTGDVSGSLLLTCLLFVWAYLTVVKSSRIRTVGYRITGSRIVNLRGERPSLFRMTFRMLLWAFGPFNLLADLFWCGIDEDRQTLRDRFSGTCVIKHRAEPIGTGEIHLAHYFAFGFTLMYPRVTRPKD